MNSQKQLRKVRRTRERPPSCRCLCISQELGETAERGGRGGGRMWRHRKQHNTDMREKEREGEGEEKWKGEGEGEREEEGL